jgi:hypothetical protein
MYAAEAAAAAAEAATCMPAGGSCMPVHARSSSQQQPATTMYKGVA